MKTLVALLFFAAAVGVYGWLYRDQAPSMRRAAIALVAFMLLAIALAASEEWISH